MSTATASPTRGLRGPIGWTVGGNLVDIIVLPDSDVTVPTQTITIRFPASAAKLL